MNHQLITINLVAIVLSIFILVPIFGLCANAFLDNSYPELSAADQWTLIDRTNDSFALFEYLKNEGYVSNEVTFGEFDYICVLTQQLCTMTKQVPPEIAVAMIAVESNFNQYLQSGSARGLMQLIPIYHSKRMGSFVEKGHQIDLEDFFNPRLNIATGLDYFDYILGETNGDINYALMWYNQGPTSASKDYIDYRRISTYARKVEELAKSIKTYLGEEVG